MAGLQLGLEIAFYLYPVALFVALFSAQLISFRRRDSAKAPAPEEKNGEKAERFYARLIWVLQLLLTPSLVRCVRQSRSSRRAGKSVDPENPTDRLPANS